MIDYELSYDWSKLEIEHASILIDLTMERHVYDKIIEKTRS